MSTSKTPRPTAVPTAKIAASTSSVGAPPASSRVPTAARARRPGRRRPAQRPRRGRAAGRPRGWASRTTGIGAVSPRQSAVRQRGGVGSVTWPVSRALAQRVRTAAPSTRSAARSARARSACVERVLLVVHLQLHGRGEAQELLAVGAGVGRDRPHDALAEQVPLVVRAPGRRCRWMPAIASVPASSRAASAAGTISPAGAKMIAESSGSGGASKVSPALAQPRSSASARASGDRVMTCTVGALVHGDLRREVGRGPEAVDAEPPARRAATPAAARGSR